MKSGNLIAKLQGNIVVIEKENKRLSEKDTLLGDLLTKTEGNLQSLVEKQIGDLKKKMAKDNNLVKAEFTNLKKQNLEENINQISQKLKNFIGVNKGEISDLDKRITYLDEQLRNLRGLENTGSKIKEIEDSFNTQVEDKIQIAKVDINERIDGLEDNFHELTKTVDDKLK